MKKITLISICLFAIQTVFGQYSFDTTSLFQNLKLLSADSMEGRKTGTEGNKKARTLIIDYLKKAGIDPYVEGYVQPFSITQTSGMVQPGDGVNILAVIPGVKKETIVISAHYDHLGVRNNMVYNGADDNASGTAAVLAMADYFKKHAPEHRIIIALFDAEEMGLKGSAYFTNTVDLEKEKIILNINMDMISRSDKNELYASGGYHYPKVKEKIENMKTPDGIKLSFGHDDPALKRDDWTSQSDQRSFHVKKIPFVYFGVEDHMDYHKPGDDFEKIDHQFYANSVETILQAVKILDKGL